MASLDQVRQAKPRAMDLLCDVAGVNGVGITKVTRGGDDYALKINLESDANVDLPKEVAGVPLVVEVVGKVRKRVASKRAK